MTAGPYSALKAAKVVPLGISTIVPAVSSTFPIVDVKVASELAGNTLTV